MADSIISVVRLAWVFRGRMDRARITAILETIVTLAPSCAPVYGPSRKYALADVGVDGIAAAAERAEGSAVFGVRAPVAEMRMSLGSDGLQAGCGFHQFCLMVHADAARGPRLGRELTQLLSGVAVASRSFYAEARLREVQRQGRTIVGPLPELPLDPLPFNGWAGIPVEPALAVAVGPPYAALWPELTEVGVTTASQVTVVADALLDGTARVPVAPATIRQAFDPRWTPFPDGSLSPTGVRADMPTPHVIDWPFSNDADSEDRWVKGIDPHPGSVDPGRLFDITPAFAPHTYSNDCLPLIDAAMDAVFRRASIDAADLFADGVVTVEQVHAANETFRRAHGRLISYRVINAGPVDSRGQYWPQSHALIPTAGFTVQAVFERGYGDIVFRLALVNDRMRLLRWDFYEHPDPPAP